MFSLDIPAVSYPITDVVLWILTRGQIDMALASILLRVQQKYPALDIRISQECFDVGSGRNTIVKRFLEGTKGKYLILLDDDVLPCGLFLRLPEWDVPVVSGVVHALGPHQVPMPALYRFKDGMTEIPCEIVQKAGKVRELVEVDSAGAALLCIRREVLEHPHVQAGGPFTVERDSWGIHGPGGEDTAFCRRVKAAGFGIFADMSVIGSHHARAYFYHLSLGMEKFIELEVESRITGKPVRWLKKPDGTGDRVETPAKA